MSNYSRQPAESHKNTPEQDVLGFIARRLNAVATVRQQLEVVDAANEAPQPQVDLNPYYNPNVGRLATERTSVSAQTMGNVVNLAEYQVAERQKPAEASLWTTGDERPTMPMPPNQGDPGSFVDYGDYVRGIATSSEDIRNDLEKAA